LEDLTDLSGDLINPYSFTSLIMKDEPSQPVPDAGPTMSPKADPVDPSLPGASPAGAARRLPLWLPTLVVGLVAGLVAWAGGEAAFATFRTEREIIKPPNFNKVSGYEKQALVTQITGEARVVAERKKAMASFGLLGLVLGVGLGLVGGWANGSSRTAWSGAVGGGLAGVAAGAGLSWAAVPLFFRYMDPEMGLLILFMIHAAIFTGVGAAAGLALGLGLGDRPATVRALFGGMLGGLVGTIALEAIISTAYPLMRTFEPIASERTPRLWMYLCVAVATALCAGIAAGGRARWPHAVSN
jgi:hypothetical protein